MQFYGISFMDPYKHQSHPAIDQTAYMDPRKKCHKTACTSLPEDEHLDVRALRKTDVTCDTGTPLANQQGVTSQLLLDLQ
jgi:hypothetical protein